MCKNRSTEPPLAQKSAFGGGGGEGGGGTEHKD